MKTAVLALLLLLAATAASELTRSKRLTAFGKSPSNPSPPPLIGKGRECKADKDCEVIPYTSCRTDSRDSRKRCICRDGTPPSNGQCTNRPRDLVLFRPAPTPPFFPTPALPKMDNSSSTRRPLFTPHNRLGLREACNSDAECLEGAECKTNPNATTTAAQRQRVCLCREGRMEMSNVCNGSERGVESGTVILAIGFVALLVAARAN